MYNVTVNDIPNTLRVRREGSPHLTDQELLAREVARWKEHAAMWGGGENLAERTRKELAFTEATNTVDAIFDAAGEEGICTWDLPDRLAEASTDFVSVDALKDMLLRDLDYFARAIGGVYYAKQKPRVRVLVESGGSNGVSSSALLNFMHGLSGRKRADDSTAREDAMLALSELVEEGAIIYRDGRYYDHYARYDLYTPSNR